jgi:hypothetical protein
METEVTLSSAWDQHLARVAAQSPEQRLATMTAEPYVNVVPLMIGSGRNETPTSTPTISDPDPVPDMETVPVPDPPGRGGSSMS